MRKVRYKGKPSEIMDPLEIDGVSVRVLKHGNTGHILYYAPRMEDQEYQWTMDLETVRKSVAKFNEEKAAQKTG
jgi:hypothetical protein